jgi:hypothetical protein
MYGFSEFLDFPERVQRQFYTIYVEITLSNNGHPLLMDVHTFRNVL